LVGHPRGGGKKNTLPTLQGCWTGKFFLLDGVCNPVRNVLSFSWTWEDAIKPSLSSLSRSRYPKNPIFSKNRIFKPESVSKKNPIFSKNRIFKPENILMKTPKIEILPLRAAVSTDAPTTPDVLVKIIPPELEEDIKRPTLNLGLVIDRSGSMGGRHKMQYARQAACYAVEQLQPTDRVSVTIYDDRVDTLVASTLAVDKANIIRRINQISPRSMTALHAGWAEGCVQVSQHLNAEHLNRVILLSDGLANVGKTNPDDIATDVHRMTQGGVSTTTIGVGDDYNEDLMEAMAVSGDGNYYYIQSPEQLPNIFGRELQGLMTTFGTTVTLGIEPQGDVTVVDMLNDLKVNSNGRYRLPNLLVASPIEIVVRLKVPAMAEETDLCYFRLAWNDPKQQERQNIRVGLRLPVLSSAQLEKLPFNTEVQQQVALLMAARAKKEAVQLVDRGDYDQASEVLAQSKAQMLDFDLPMLDSEAEALTDLADELKARQLASYRKRSSYQSHTRTHSKSHRDVDLFYRFCRGPIKGDITQELTGLRKPIQAIVNSTDENLSNSGSLSSAIHLAAGPQLLEACRQLKGCAEGEAKITEGYNLPSPWVIHTVCPRWQDGNHGEERQLAHCYRSCLELAEKHNIRSIAFPAIGAGGMGFPLKLAAKVAIQETARFIAHNRSIGEILFVCFDDKVQHYFEAEFWKIAKW
jgi:Ca-activated chloride channel family protein